MKAIKSAITKILNDKGETMVEVMVAFIVLLMVLAIFGNSVLATGDAEVYAKELRTEADTGMKELQIRLGDSTNTSAVPTGSSKTGTVTGSSDVKAVQYKTDTDGLIYWVFE